MLVRKLIACLLILPLLSILNPAIINAFDEQKSKDIAIPESGLPYLTEPAISPDHAEIAFVSGGDIWVVPAKGGEAHLLISHPANESRPIYSPDGRKLAFI